MEFREMFRPDTCQHHIWFCQALSVHVFNIFTLGTDLKQSMADLSAYQILLCWPQLAMLWGFFFVCVWCDNVLRQKWDPWISEYNGKIRPQLLRGEAGLSITTSLLLTWE